MPNVDLPALYENFTRVEPLPASVFMVLFNRALAADDEQTLLKLIPRPDAPPAALAEAAKLTSSRCRVAYLSRPDHDTETLAAAVRSETRARVLAAVATSAEVSVEFLESVSHDTRQSVAYAVMMNPRTPASAQLRAIRTLIPHRTALGSSQMAELIAAIDALSPSELSALVCETTDRIVLEKLVASPKLNAAAQSHMFDRLIASLMEQAAAGYASTDTRVRGNADYLRQRVQRTLISLAAHPQLAEDVALRALALAPQITGSATPPPQWLAAQARMRNITTDDAHRQRLLLAHTGTDAAALAGLANAVAHKRIPDDGLLVGLLSANPNTPPSSVVILVESLASKARADLLAREDCPDSVAVAIWQAEPSLLTEDRIQERSDPENCIRNLAEQAATNMVARLTDLQLIDATGLLLVPWSSITTRPTTRSTLPLLATALDQHLGEKLSCWAAFEALTADWGSSLGALLNTAVMIADDSASSPTRSRRAAR